MEKCINPDICTPGGWCAPCRQEPLTILRVEEGRVVTKYFNVEFLKREKYLLSFKSPLTVGLGWELLLTLREYKFSVEEITEDRVKIYGEEANLGRILEVPGLLNNLKELRKFPSVPSRKN